jgi:hypothetical protein
MVETASAIKMYGKWSLDDVEVSDISLTVRNSLMNLDYVIYSHGYPIL